MKQSFDDIFDPTEPFFWLFWLTVPIAWPLWLVAFFVF